MNTDTEFLKEEVKREREHFSSSLILVIFDTLVIAVMASRRTQPSTSRSWQKQVVCRLVRRLQFRHSSSIVMLIIFFTILDFSPMVCVDKLKIVHIVMICH